MPIRIGLLVTLLCCPSSALAQPFVYRENVKVLEGTRLDWLFPILRTSPPEVPEEILDEYVSERQRYDLYGPRGRVRAASPLPLILFVPFLNTPFGWEFCGATCIRNAVVYAEPRNAGNSVPTAERIRIVLDVLDDVRRRYPIDPDRTYLVGHSGGGFTANQIAFALPELFGGVMSSSAPPLLPTTSWTLRRIQDRLSVAMHAGGREDAGKEVGLVRGPIFANTGIRTRYQVHQGHGHTMVPAINVERTFTWFEEGLADRRALAHRFPASRMIGAFTREQSAERVFADAQQRLSDRKLISTGLQELVGIQQRWPDLDVAVRAKTLITDHDARDPRPWEAHARRERLRVTRIVAEIYTAASQDPRMGRSKIRRAVLARGALANWRVIVQESDDEDLKAAAERHLPTLEAIAGRDSKRLEPTRQ